jgi:hypothetical protein
MKIACALANDDVGGARGDVGFAAPGAPNELVGGERALCTLGSERAGDGIDSGRDRGVRGAPPAGMGSGRRELAVGEVTGAGLTACMRSIATGCEGMGCCIGMFVATWGCCGGGKYVEFDRESVGGGPCAKGVLGVACGCGAPYAWCWLGGGGC